MEKFLGPALLKEHPEEKQNVKIAKPETLKKPETFNREKSPNDVKKPSLTGSDGSGRINVRNKNALGEAKKTLKSSEKVAFKPKDRMIKSYSKLSGDLELSDDVISLSDEELPTETSVERKRKRPSGTGKDSKRSSSSKSKKHRSDEVKPSHEKKAKRNASVLSSLDSNARPSKDQEEILLAAFR